MSTKVADVSAGQCGGAAITVAGVVHLLLAAHQPTLPWSLAFALAGVGMAGPGCRLLTSATAATAATRVIAIAATSATVLGFVLVHTGLAGVGAGDHGLDQLGLLVTGLEVAGIAGLVRTGARLVPLRQASVALAAIVVASSTVAVAAPGPGARPDGCVQPTRRLTLYAVEITEPGGPIRLGYGFTPDTASSPGPTIDMIEGDCTAITLVNEVAASTLEALRDRFPTPPGEERSPLGVSLHVHGVKYTTDSDGTIHTRSWVPPGESRTYVWHAAPRVTAGGRVASLGTAGYWWYHDHIAGTSHGTGGLEAGLFGAVVVRRPGDPLPDRQYAVAPGPTPNINMRAFPATFTCDDTDAASNTCFLAEKGERVEFVVFAVGDDFHTFHLHGHNWADNRTGMLTSQTDEAQLIDAKTVGPSESFGFQIIAGESVGPGDWMLHCHVQSHSDLGMVSYFRVRDEAGTTVGTSGLEGHVHAATHNHER